MPAYSLDLRIRVMAAYCQPGARQAAVAARFGVSVSFFKKLLRHERQTGSLVPKPASGGRARYLDAEVLAWGAPIPEFSQEVDMPRIAAMARQAQPGILLVDRTVHGPYENYQTPEQRVPAQPLPQPWESCLTLANNWGYVPGDTYKSPTRIIHTLVEVVAKGGSLLLGVGPRPDGTLADEATTRLAAIGKWLAVNGPAIYSTRATARFQDGSTYFTQGKNGTRYAIACLPEGQPCPATLTWHGNLPKKNSRLTLLQTGQAVRWTRTGDAVTVTLPTALEQRTGAYPALAFAYVAE